ncbi:hypothetical protein PR202_ga05690 [Eleusine coracana subsp. coracana]|uniref:VQ domain-containing protein n=1 Tax=Eleusine coracana subsp. coracana TaxID=191504 RepID=A0AAV5BS92_ELECO|nr:hypothetical protein QOZ80_5AG0366380 [Eleusine coracana subsp. coracana]GJM89091.1 hypothetical protein PR202_ga05236 [Eleusine coracana subsp. coracana]GJM89492.1 hypothetical protein PR202_ga05690 [Eleusine coracana subsp. coracana]
MEVAAARQLLPMPPPPPRDPHSPSSSTSSSSPSSPSGHPLPPSPRPAAVPRVIDTTPFPTTFVQADTASFKQVVQMLTGSDTPSSPKPAAAAKTHHHHNHSNLAKPKKPAFKLYDRRGLKNLKMIAPLAMAAAAAGGPSPRQTAPDVLSPSVLDFPSLALSSPVTPLLADPFNRSSPASSSASPGEEEAAAIAHRGFFLHPSPRSAEPPRLLPLFPVTSPRMASSAAPAAQ